MNKVIKQKFKKWKYKAKASLFNPYSYLKYHTPVWKMLNRSAIAQFKHNRPQLDDLQTRILQEIQTKGIAVTSLEELFPGEKILDDLKEYIEKKEERARGNNKKRYLVDYLSGIPELGKEIPFFSLALRPRIVDIVNSYLGMYGKLYQFIVQRTELSTGKEPEHGQNWHRAPQERKLCKVYIYLNDVTDGSGPFMYIPESTRGKKWGRVYPSARGGYLSNNKIEEIIPETERLAVTGKAGTVIFADTTGLHRGGYSTESTRKMSTFAYGAPTYRENISYSFTDSLLEEIKDLPSQSQFTLHTKWMRQSH